MKCAGILAIVGFSLVLIGCGDGVIEVEDVERFDVYSRDDFKTSSSGGNPSSLPHPDGFQAEIGQRLPGGYEICDQVVRDAVASESPNVLLVVDRSGSMRDATSSDSSRSKLRDMKEALFRLLDFGVDRIRFGWMPFPLNRRCWPGLRTVDCSDTSVPAISWRVFLLTARGGTPTGETLWSVLDYDAMRDSSRKNFVILLTDGMPTCPYGDGAEPNQADNQLALGAVEALRARGIGTFVVGLGEDLNVSNPQLLNQLARAGGQARSGSTSYYPANNLWELEDALDAIGHQVLSCTLKLNTPPDSPGWLWVTFDSVPVSRDVTHRSGWDYEPDLNQIRFFGPTCDRLQTGEIDQIVVKVGCRTPY